VNGATRRLVAAVAAALALSGCYTARVVAWNPGERRVAVAAQAGWTKATERDEIRALNLARNRCHSEVELVEERTENSGTGYISSGYAGIVSTAPIQQYEQVWLYKCKESPSPQWIETVEYETEEEYVEAYSVWEPQARAARAQGRQEPARPVWGPYRPRQAPPKPAAPKPPTVEKPLDL